MILLPFLSYPPSYCTVTVMPDLFVSDLSSLHFSHLSTDMCMFV